MLKLELPQDMQPRSYAPNAGVRAFFLLVPARSWRGLVMTNAMSDVALYVTDEDSFVLLLCYYVWGDNSRENERTIQEPPRPSTRLSEMEGD